MALTEKQKKWRNDWEKKNRCNLACKVHKDYAAHAKQVAAENGDTISGILKVAMDAYLEEHGRPFTKPRISQDPGGKNASGAIFWSTERVG